MKLVSNDSSEELESALARMYQREQRLRSVISSSFISVDERLETRSKLDSIQETINEYEDRLAGIALARKRVEVLRR